MHVADVMPAYQYLPLQQQDSIASVAWYELAEHAITAESCEM